MSSHLLAADTSLQSDCLLDYDEKGCSVGKVLLDSAHPSSQLQANISCIPWLVSFWIVYGPIVSSPVYCQSGIGT